MKKESLLSTLGNKKRLSPTEQRFMEFLWQYPEGVNSEQVYEAFSQARGTKSTILYNLSQKGYMDKRQEGLHYIYTPLVSREEYEQALLCQQLEDSFGEASFARLVAAFCGKKQLNEEQQARAQAFLQEIKESVNEDNKSR